MSSLRAADGQSVGSRCDDEGWWEGDGRSVVGRWEVGGRSVGGRWKVGGGLEVGGRSVRGQ